MRRRPPTQARISSACWSSSGGAAWSFRVTSSPAASKKRSGGPGSVMSAERRVLDVDEQALAGDLVPLVDLVERAHLAGGHADLGEAGEQRLGVPVGEGRLDDLDHPVALGRPARSLVASPSASGSIPKPPQNRFHSPSLPSAICTAPSRQRKSP